MTIDDYIFYGFTEREVGFLPRYVLNMCDEIESKKNVNEIRYRSGEISFEEYVRADNLYRYKLECILRKMKIKLVKKLYPNRIIPM